jgi:hypothetical protein
MRRSVPVLVALPIMLALVPTAWGQQAVSARAGLIQYVEGRVLLDGQEIAPKPNEFLQVEKGQTLSTEDGRAEILLTPGAFLRLSENSSFKMISGNLSDARLEVLSGSAMVEVEELLKDNAVTLQSGSTSVSLKKHGLYRVDADGAANFKVYDGEAVVTSPDKTVTAKKGREVQLDETLAETKFDVDATDPFYRWSERRAGYVATANVSSARSVGSSGSGYGSGLGSSGLGCNGLGYNTAVGYNSNAYYNSPGYYPSTGCGGLGYGGWTYNPWFGMYTYVPLNGFGYSPFGYAIYSPVTVRSIAVQPIASSVPASTQRTISPPTVRTASTPGTSVLGRTGAGGISSGGNSGGSAASSSSGGSSNGGGSVAGRMSGGASGGISAGGGGGARSSGGGGGGRGR